MSRLVSILIPCYNAERWVAAAIESALAQTWPEKEVIVVDDGSTDGSLDIIRRFAGRILWDTGPNRGGNATRNRLLALAHGDWLQYLDADDYLLPEKVRHQTACIDDNPDCDVVYSPVVWEHMEGGRVVQTGQRICGPYDPWHLLARWALPQTGGSLWRKSALENAGGWCVGLPCCQEHELYFRMIAAGGSFVYCPESQAVYRDWDHGIRVSHKDPKQTDRQRLTILDQVESCLRERNELDAARRQAINETRHGIARRWWRDDRTWALGTVRRIAQSDPCYRPGRFDSSQILYGMAYTLLGFRGAETLAYCKRTIAGTVFAAKGA